MENSFSSVWYTAVGLFFMANIRCYKYAKLLPQSLFGRGNTQLIILHYIANKNIGSVINGASDWYFNVITHLGTI